ncbi:hypothetical protein [Pedobacter faecalis]|uniref:hypothetical protein n=1 Tax=Pedobacter faecalis TaxID=3041495 RepID=UPI00254C0BED|nr:hypothetical protein [Pedobacter sp. ELA7]
MNQLQQLQREVRTLKEDLQDAITLASKYKPHMGLIDQEELARVGAKVTGASYNAKDWDLTDKNGEQ